MPVSFEKRMLLGDGIAFRDAAPADNLTEEDKARIMAVAGAQPSATDKFLTGARSGAGFVESLGDILVEKVLTSNLVPEEMRETPESARQLAHLTRLGKDPGVLGRADLKDDLAVKAGNIAAMVLDPTSAIPIAPKLPFVAAAQTGRSAAITGAAVAGADVAAFQRSRTGEVDPKDVAVASAFGAVLGPVLHFGGQYLAGVLGRAKAHDVPVTGKQLEVALGGAKEGEFIPGGGRPSHSGRQGTTIEGEVVQPRLGRADIPGVFREVVDSGIDDTLRLINGRQWDSLAVKLNQQLRIGHTPNPKTVVSSLESLGRTVDPHINRYVSRLAEDFGVPQVDRLVPLEPSLGKALVIPKKEGVHLMEEPGSLLARAVVRPAGKANTSHLVKLDEPDLTKIPEATERAIANDAFDNERNIAKLVAWYQKLDKAARDPSAKGTVPHLIANTRKGPPNGQGGFTNVQLTSTLAGAGLGYAWDGPDGAIIGAAIGAGLPYGAGRLRRIGTKSKGKPTPSERTDGDNWFELLRGWSTSRPKHIIGNHFGQTGRIFADALERAQDNTDLLIANKMADFDALLARVGVKVNGPEVREAVELLQHVRKSAAATPIARKIAGLLQREFDQVLVDAVDADIMSAGRAAALKKRSRVKGYWPRVYNEAFLSTAEGKEKWMEVFANTRMTQEQMLDTVEAILGKGNKLAQTIIKRLKSGDGLVWMDRETAELLRKGKRKVTAVSRSGHLENTRTLHVKSEEILRPFLLDDPKAVITSYFDDVYKRIGMAKEFGAKDEKALALMKSIEESQGTGAAKLAGEVYWHAVRDTRSMIIRQQASMPEGVESLLGRLDALETLKLTLSAVKNMGQATVNGSVVLARMTGNPYKGLGVLASIAKQIRTNPGKFTEQAARSGAALETSILQVIGEYSKLTHRIAGREFTGVWSPLEMLNNPTKFLETVQFINAEKLQRNIASNMGRAYAEELQETLKNIEIGGNVSPAKAARTKAALKELGISWEKGADNFDDDDFFRAGLRFSNKVNFRNRPGDAPILWGSPYASWFRKFKTFAFNQGAFLSDNILTPARNGNIKGAAAALTAYLTVGGAVGWTTDRVTRLLAADDKDFSGTEQILRAWGAVGSAGLVMDTLTAHNPATNVAGPAISDFEKVIAELQRFSTGKQGAADTGLDILFGTQVLPGEKKLKELTGRGKRQGGGRRVKPPRSGRPSPNR